MRIDWYTLALQTVNFAVLVWLLHRFLYRPVLRMVDSRRAQIEAEREAARKTAVEAKDQLAAIAAERASIAAERARALASAAAEADTLKHDRQATAEREAAALLDAARNTLASERERALNDVQRTALDLAGDYLARLLAGLPREVQAEAWLERIESHLKSLPRGEREALSHQLSATSPLTVVTASALAPQVLEIWRENLAHAVGADALAFAVDPALGAGAELHFPGATLSFSLRSAVAALRGELERRAPCAAHPH
jgi:F-type H+-transporting ATPase subunit b